MYKYGKRTRQLKSKRELKFFPQETMAAGENRFSPELNEKDVIELLENRNTREHKESHKVWHENISSKSLKTLF